MKAEKRRKKSRVPVFLPIPSKLHGYSQCICLDRKNALDRKRSQTKQNVPLNNHENHFDHWIDKRYYSLYLPHHLLVVFFGVRYCWFTVVANKYRLVLFVSPIAIDHLLSPRLLVHAIFRSLSNGGIINNRPLKKNPNQTPNNPHICILMLEIACSKS